MTHMKVFFVEIFSKENNKNIQLGRQLAQFFLWNILAGWP